MRAAALLLIASCGSEIDPLSFSDLAGGTGLKPPDVELPEAPLAPDVAALEAWADAPPQVALPVLVPCPAGWTEVDGEVPHCDPWPEGRAVCTGASAHFPGEAGCREVGSACPAGLFAEVGGAKLYVLPGAVGGDGSLALPFGTIAAAIQAATAATATTVLLAKGRFDESITIDRDLALVGACAAETIIAGVVTATQTVKVTGKDVTIRDLQLTGPRDGVLFNQAPADAELGLEGLLISATGGGGVVAIGSGISLHGHDLIVRDAMGIGIAVFGARAELSAVALERAHEDGVSAHQAAVVTLTDSVVAGTSTGHGDGVHAYGGAHVSLLRCAMERNRRVNAFGVEPGSRISVLASLMRDASTGLRAQSGASFDIHQSYFTDHDREAIGIDGDGEASIVHVLAVRNGTPVDGDPFGAIHLTSGTSTLSWVAILGSRDVGLVVSHDATAHATNFTVRDSDRVGVLVSDENAGTVRLSLENAALTGNVGALRVVRSDASAELHNVWIADNLDPGSNAGSAIFLLDGSTVTGTSVRAERNEGWAVSVHGGASLKLQDLVVRDTKPTMNVANSGRALNAYGASIEVIGALIERNTSIAIEAEVQGSITIENAIIRDTLSEQVTRAYGIAGLALAGGLIQLRQVRVERSRGLAFAIDGAGSELDLTNVAVADTLSDEIQDRFAYALQASRGAIARFAGVELSRCRGFGAVVEGASLTGSNLAIIDTRSTEKTMEYGGGIYAYAGARVDLERVLVESNRHVGIAAADPGTEVDLVQLTVRGTRSAECSVDACWNRGVGSGLAIQEGATMRVEQFSLKNNYLAGFHILTGASFDAKNGEVSGNPVGADVQIEDYDVRRISDGVFYENVRDLQSITLAIPRPDALLGLPGS